MRFPRLAHFDLNTSMGSVGGFDGHDSDYEDAEAGELFGVEAEVNASHAVSLSGPVKLANHVDMF